MTLNIDYQQLGADDKVEIKKKIRDVLAASASVDQATVSVTLTPGSVKVDARIQTPDANSAKSIEKSMNTDNIAKNVVEAANSIPGVKAAATGELKVTGLEVKTATRITATFDQSPETANGSPVTISPLSDRLTTTSPSTECFCGHGQPASKQQGCLGPRKEMCASCVQGYTLDAEQVCKKEQRCYCHDGTGADQCHKGNMTFRCETCDPGFELDTQTWTCKGKQMICSRELVTCTGPQSVGTGNCAAQFSDVRSIWVLVSSRDVCSTCTAVEESVTVTIGVDQEVYSQVDASVSSEASGAFLTGSVSASMTHAITSTMSYSKEESKTFSVSTGSSVYFWQLMVFWKINGKDHKIGLDRYTQTSSPDIPCPPSFNSTCTQTFSYQCPGTVNHAQDKLLEDTDAGGLSAVGGTVGGAIGGLVGLGVLGRVAWMLKVKCGAQQVPTVTSPDNLDSIAAV